MTVKTEDIVKRLRTGVYGINRIELCSEAADEIEKLRDYIDMLQQSLYEYAERDATQSSDL